MHFLSDVQTLVMRDSSLVMTQCENNLSKLLNGTEKKATQTSSRSQQQQENSLWYIYDHIVCLWTWPDRFPALWRDKIKTVFIINACVWSLELNTLELQWPLLLFFSKAQSWCSRTN